MKLKIIYILLLVTLLSGCMGTESEIKNTTISIIDADCNGECLRDNQGVTIIKTEYPYREIKEWHVNEDVTCWSYAENNDNGLEVYSGFSCLRNTGSNDNASVV